MDIPQDRYTNTVLTDFRYSDLERILNVDVVVYPSGPVIPNSTCLNIILIAHNYPFLTLILL